MDLCNYHTHCDFCDGKAPAEEFVKAAVAAGFHSYGISSHAPLPFRTNWTLERERVPAYLAEVERLKRKYAPVMELYVGMEIDYVTEEWNPSSAYFRELPLDYRVGAVHFVAGAGGEFMDIDGPADIFQANMRRLFDGDLRRLVEAYFDASERMVEAGGFDFIAHPDKIAMNALTVDAEVTEREWYENRVRAYFALVADRGVMMEVNTKVYCQRGMMFPDRRYFKWLGEMGVPLLVNADTHVPGYVNDGRARAFEWLSEAGVRSTMRLRKGKWEEVAIND